MVMLLSLTASLFAERQLVRIFQPDPSFVESAFHDNKDIGFYKPGEFIDLVLNDAELSQIRIKYPHVTVLQTEQSMKDNLSQKDRDIDGYRSYSQMVADLENYQNTYPNLCQMTDLGPTYGVLYQQQGMTNYNDFDHHVYAFKVSDNVQSEEDEPNVYFFGMHHAREPLSMEVSMYVLNHLLTQYATDTEIQNLINNTQIWFIPAVNPDGYKIVFDQTDVWWRKNIKDNNNNNQFDTYNNYGYGPDGIDINRNYSWGWGYFSASDDPTAVTFHGTEAFSEIETNYVKDFLNARHFVAGISYHTYSGLVLFPWGGKPYMYAPDYQALSGLAESMAQTILKTDGSGNHYIAEPGWALYAASGGLDDFAYGTHGTFAYTIELGESFIPTAPIVQQTKINNLQAALMMIKRVHKEVLTGHITDEDNHPLQAEIFIEGIDDTGVPRLASVSDSLYGRYDRLLVAGVYPVSYYKRGYIPQTITTPVSEASATFQNITLLPAQNCSLQGYIYDEFGNPLENCRVFIDHNSLTETLTDAFGFFMINDLYTGTYPLRIQKQNTLALKTSITLHENNNHQVFQINGTYYSDNFDSGNLLWNKIGSWGLCTTQSYSGNRSLSDSPNGNYNENEYSYCQYPQAVELSNCTSASVSFMTKYDVGLNSEFVSFEISTDNINWQALDVFAGDQSEWIEKSYCLNSLLGQSIYFRFVLETNYNSFGNGIFIDDFNICKTSHTVGNENQENIKPAIVLTGNYPNPFNPQTALCFEIDKAQNVMIDVFNIKGQKVKSLTKYCAMPGKNEIIWNGMNDQSEKVTSGIYFYKLSGNSDQSVKKMLLLK